MDLVVRVARLPQPGDTVLGERLLRIPGGKGANQAVAAARLGALTRMVGRVGADAFGKELLSGLRDDGVDVDAVGVDPVEPSGAALIVVEEGGDNIITVAPGANGRVGEPEVDVLRAELSPGDVLVLQLEIPISTVLAAVQAGRDAGARVVLNAAPSAGLVNLAVPAVDLLVVNETEAADLGGAERLRAAASAVVVTLGANGSILYEKKRETVIEARRVDAVDATAAGDAFVGALAFAMAHGSSLVDAARLGNAAGAAAATRVGARPSLPAPRDLERLFGLMVTA
jgi:ribokinase